MVIFENGALRKKQISDNDEGNACDKDIYASLQEAKTSELSVHHDVNRGYECPQQDDVSLQEKRSRADSPSQSLGLRRLNFRIY